MWTKICIAFIVLIFINKIESAGMCSVVKSADGSVTLDLSPLANRVFESDNIRDESNQQTYNYEFNACDNMNKMCNNFVSGICQEWPGGQANLGSFSTLTVTADGFLAKYTNGEQVDGISRTVDFTVTCDQSSEAKIDTLSNVPGSLNYRAIGKSKYACKDGLTPVFFIILMILVGGFVVYLIVGFALNKAGNRDGFHPHAEIITGFPGLVKDGALFIGSKTCCRNQ